LIFFINIDINQTMEKMVETL